MGDIKYVSMTMDHYENVLRLWKETENIAVGESDTPASIGRYLERNPGLSLVATDGERVVGAVLCGHDGRRGFIWHLAVDKEYRKGGIGRELADRSLKALAGEGIIKCYILVLDGNEKAKAFWKRAGWRHADKVNLLFHPVETDIDSGC